MPDPGFPPAEEDALMQRLARGDPQAAALLAARLVPRLLGLGTRMLGDRAEAEDIVQETLLRLWRMAPDWQPGQARVGTWVWRVAVNLATDRLRRRRPLALGDVPGGAEALPDPDHGAAETGLMRAERARALRTALAALPPRQAQAVALRHLEGLSNPEIAAIMEIGVEAVESLTARGRRALADRLRPCRAALGLESDNDQA